MLILRGCVLRLPLLRLASTEAPAARGLLCPLARLRKQLSKDVCGGTAPAWNTTRSDGSEGIVNQFTATDTTARR